MRTERDYAADSPRYAIADGPPQLRIGGVEDEHPPPRPPAT